ncbi:hypothetical protein HBI56_012660 [Parastagonospora nodorum]|nr:hypothetical protein HBI10_092680 [Parastagonospora nodorum]KAH4033637.1 hypothetical protein HBI13_013060 [Parastagonospora nodorum]KAH4152026.1 hypothetical protein HBH43_237260 [Parastagonospora nodorum]KAH4274635.1 hypothetical protein HBI03_007100 [Parastagonospora nodorum]KAH4284574.1 hypothetical protein HBI04_012900 [Parastagonospora nodorum]
MNKRSTEASIVVFVKGLSLALVFLGSPAHFSPCFRSFAIAYTPYFSCYSSQSQRLPATRLTVAMPPRRALRRPHKKSRLGCEECKRRHVKCDEARPNCTNCLTVSRTCIYQSSSSSTTRSSSAPIPRSSSSTAADSTVTTPVTVPPTLVSLGLLSNVSTPSLSITSIPGPDSTTPPSVQCGALCSPVNIHHMELFSQFLLDTGPSLYEGGSTDYKRFHAIVPIALSAPYAMYQILAISALHLSHIRTAQASHYREEATALQTEALSRFNDVLPEITIDSCAPMLLFSTLLSLHTLEEAVTASETDAGGFLDRFVMYLDLHRGVRAVTSESWQLLLHSNISSPLRHAERALESASLQSNEQATFVADRLHVLVNDADMGPESEQACREAVESLQLVYRSTSSIGKTSPESDPGVVWAWPTLLSGVFTKLLIKRNPEALIILCHYAVLLHRRRHIWLVRNAGQMLISEITRFLGTYWSDWLDWPNKVLPDLL